VRHRTRAWWLAPIAGLAAGFCAYFLTLIGVWSYVLGG
jgi:hypothetical protein